MCIRDSVLWGEFALDMAGAKVLAQDVNGDDEVDLWVSAYNRSDTEDGAGAVYLVLGPIPSGAIELSDSSDLILHGEDLSGAFGYGLGSAGDVDDDGLDDVMIGAPGGGGWVGHVMLIQGADIPL